MGEEYPVIICGGEKGRAIIYGYVTEDPVKGKPVRQTRGAGSRWECRRDDGFKRRGARVDGHQRDTSKPEDDK